LNAVVRFNGWCFRGLQIVGTAWAQKSANWPVFEHDSREVDSDDGNGNGTKLLVMVLVVSWEGKRKRVI
jgi:hypothetical protein